MNNIVGTSVSGIGTSLFVPDLGLTFDIGYCSRKTVGNANIVCITHGHMDHVGQAAYLRALRAMCGLPPPVYYVPEYLEERFRKFMNVSGELDESKPKFLDYGLVSVKPGQKYLVKPGTWIQPISSPHSIPMVSYVVWKEIKKLKPEFQNMPGVELGKLRNSGFEIQETNIFPVFAYTGDTTVKAYETNPVLLEVQTLAMELTFFEEYDEVAAENHGHTHINSLKKIADKFNNKQIVLVHPSARYNKQDKLKAYNFLPDSFRVKSKWLEENIEQ